MAGTLVLVPAASCLVDTAQVVANEVLTTTVLEFPNCILAANGSGYIEKLTILNKDHAAANFLACALQLFRATVTPAAANATHVLSDADGALLIDEIPFGKVVDMGANQSMMVAKGLNLVFGPLPGTSIFGILVARATVTYTTAGALVPVLSIARDPI
jgi:hypothetical protein